MNIIINGPHVRPSDAEQLFNDEEVIYLDDKDMSQLMVEIGAYPSTSKARQAGRFGVIPTGWSDKFKATKKLVVWIWNPTE